MNSQVKISITASSILLLTILSTNAVFSQQNIKAIYGLFTHVLGDNVEGFLLLSVIFILPAVLFIMMGIAFNLLFGKSESIEETEDYKEYFIIEFFKFYAMLLEFGSFWLIKIIFFIVMLKFGIILIASILGTLGFIVDTLFSTNLITYTKYKEDIVGVNTILFLIDTILYTIILIKYSYNFYVSMNFPVFKHFFIDAMQWLREMHKSFKSDAHIAMALDNFFDKNIQDNKAGFAYYIKKFEIANIARILILMILRFITKALYYITRPVLVLLKAKYFYYLFFPIIWVVSFGVNLLLTLIYLSAKLLLSVITSVWYYANVVFWFVLQLSVPLLILTGNYIGFHYFLNNMPETDYFTYVMYNLFTFITFNTLIVMLQYNVLKEYEYYYNPYLVGKNFLFNYNQLPSIAQKVTIVFVSVMSMVFVIWCCYYLVVEVLTIDVIQSELQNLYEQLRSYYKDPMKIWKYIFDYIWGMIW